MATDKKLGAEVLFRQANGNTETARVGSLRHKQLSANPNWVCMTKSTKDRKKTWGKTIDLTSIKGIGNKGGEKLLNAGYTSILAVSEASIDDIKKITGLSKAVTEEAIASAKELVAEAAEKAEAGKGAASE